VEASPDSNTNKPTDLSVFALLHPLFMALLPVLLFLNFVRDQVLPEEAIPAVVFVEGITLLLGIVCSAIFRDLYKAASAVTLMLIFTFSFRIWQAIFAGLHLPVALTTGLFYIVQVLFIYVFLQGKWRSLQGEPISIDFRSVSIVLTVVSCVLTVINGIELFAYYKTQDNLAAKLKNLMAKDFTSLKLDFSKGGPDIYYFILDGYASPLTMAEMCGLTKDVFSDELAMRGFYRMPAAFSNYDRTEFSLASSLNMQYLNKLLVDGKGPPSCVFMRLVQDCQFVRLLHSHGYKFVLISSGSFGSDSMPQADRVMRVNYVNHFGRALAYITPWAVFEPVFPLLANSMADTRLSPGKLLTELTDDNEKDGPPKFVLVHTDLAHSPYLFDEYGRRQALPPDLIPDWNPPQAYFKQWLFCQKKVIEWVDIVLKASDRRAVIIVQSDHGPGMRSKGMTERDWYNERMRILNAYYLPIKGDSPDAQSPVNNLRVVLNEYFDAKLPLLDDVPYSPANPINTFDWRDVSGELHFSPVTHMDR